MRYFLPTTQPAGFRIRYFSFTPGRTPGGGGGCLASNWVPMLEQRIDERTLNSVFQISVKTILFAVFFEKLLLFTALLILTTLNTEWFFPLRPEKLTLFYKRCIFPTPNDDSAAHCPALKKVPFLIVFFFFFCSSIGTKLVCMRSRGVGLDCVCLLSGTRVAHEDVVTFGNVRPSCRLFIRRSLRLGFLGSKLFCVSLKV